MSKIKGIVLPELVIIILIIGLIVIALLMPKFKADAYQKLTGKKVTYWDAAWCDLRIQEQIK